MKKHTPTHACMHPRDTRQNTITCRCHDSQLKTAELNPPPSPVSPLPHFTDPDVRLQSLGAGLAGDTSLTHRDKASVCSCYRNKSYFLFKVITVALQQCGRYLVRLQCIGCLSSSSYCGNSVHSGMTK